MRCEVRLKKLNVDDNFTTDAVGGVSKWQGWMDLLSWNNVAAVKPWEFFEILYGNCDLTLGTFCTSYTNRKDEISQENVAEYLVSIMDEL